MYIGIDLTHTMNWTLLLDPAKCIYRNKYFTLADSAIERRHLRSQAYQKLRQFCQSLGLQLVIVELFEVIPSAVQQQNEVCKDDMMYELEAKGLLEMAKKEIKLCQDISLGPTFVVRVTQLPYCLHFLYNVFNTYSTFVADSACPAIWSQTSPPDYPRG